MATDSVAIAELTKLVHSMFTELRADIQNLDKKIVGLDDKVQQLDAKVEQLDAKVEQLDAKVGQLDGKVQLLDDKVQQLDGKVETMGHDLADLEDQVKRQSNSIKKLRKSEFDRFMASPSAEPRNNAGDPMVKIQRRSALLGDELSSRSPRPSFS